METKLNKTSPKEVFATTSVEELIKNPDYKEFHFQDLQRELIETKINLNIIEETLIKDTVFGDLKLLKVLRKIENDAPEIVKNIIGKRLTGEEEYIVVNESRIIERPKKIYTYDDGNYIFVNNNKIKIN
jgi:hypothetical protein